MQMEFCNSTFTQKSSLKTHIASVHEEKKPFKCELCNYMCSRKSFLKTHSASVHEEKNVSSTKSELNRHFASAHKELSNFEKFKFSCIH